MLLWEMVSAFPGVRALVVGDALLDEFVCGRAKQLCRERPVPVVSARFERAFPGGAANAAANLRALGATTRFVSALSVCAIGERLRDLLNAHGIGLDGIVRSDGTRTARKRRILADEHYVTRIDDEPAGFDGPEVQEALCERLREAYPWCDVAIVSDYGGGVLGGALLRTLERLRAARPVPLLVDARDPMRYAALDADVLTPNIDEAAFATGHKIDGPLQRGAIATLARRMREGVRARALAITLGDDGVCIVDGGEPQFIDARRVAVKNTCGAGDSFVAALALAVATGAPLAEAARLGLEAAAVAVAKPYTATVTLDELRERLELLGSARSETRLDELEAVAERLRARRERGERVVLTNGVFDLLHAGHVELLRRARALGDALVVAINSDAGAALVKGPNRPITEHAQRRAVLEALGCVDEVVTFDGPSAVPVLEALRPALYARGDDRPLEELPEVRAAERIGAEVVLLPIVGELTTTRIIERVAARTPYWSPLVKT